MSKPKPRRKPRTAPTTYKKAGKLSRVALAILRTKLGLPATVRP